MLPVITLDPIQIDLQHHNHHHHHQNTGSTSSCCCCCCLTLHPVIVEFDRLLRRKQQQLEANDAGKQTGSRIGSKSMMYTTNNNNQAPSRHDGQLPTGRKYPLIWSSSVLEDCPDVQDLLFATIMHYYATQKVPNEETKGIQREDSMERFEMNNLNTIHRSLCTPGVKTLLLIADKQEILAHLKQRTSFETKSSGGGDPENGEFRDGITTERQQSNPGIDSCSSTINTATSEDCLTKDVFDDDDDDDDDPLQDPPLSSDCFQQFKPQQHSNHRTRMAKIQFIFDDGKSNVESKSVKKRTSRFRKDHQRSPCPRTSARTRRFFRNFDKYLGEALDRAQKLKHKFIHRQDGDDNDDDDGDPSSRDLIGMEQQIIGAGTFHKSYRLESVKIIELELLAIQRRFQRLGIGSRLIKCLKENNQIGPYDSMHVQIPLDDHGLREFFRKNDFSDDQILNAGFEQLKIQSNENQSLTDDDDDDDDDDGEEEEDFQESTINYPSIANLKPINHFRTFPVVGKQSNKVVANHQTISMCYLPPYSVGTLSETITNHFGLDKLDHKFVDDIIDQANMVWRRDFLSSYRTQWSCVARLRAEIIKLRQQLSQRDSSIDQLKRENFQLRNALVLNRTSLQSGSQSNTNGKHLQRLNMYKNLRFDSLDF